MLCNKVSSRGHKGVRNSKFQNAPIELKLDWKYACDILSIIKQMLWNKLSLRGHKVVRKSQFLKCFNWVETWLKVCEWHSKHDKIYDML